MSAAGKPAHRSKPCKPRAFCIRHPPGGSIMQPQWKPWAAQSRSTSFWLTGTANLRLQGVSSNGWAV